MAGQPRLSSPPLAALIVVAALATEAFGFIDSSKIFTIEGYLDRAPNGAAIVARVDISAFGTPRRQLLVTSYRGDGQPFDDAPLGESYVQRGHSRDVDRLLGATSGSAVKGTFVVYPQAIASLLIASLQSPV
jgi:hypothetical protein